MLGMIGASKISFLIRDVLWGGKNFTALLTKEEN